MTPTATKILEYLKENAYLNEVRASHQTIADATGLFRGNVSRYIKELEDEDLLFTVTGHPNTYFVVDEHLFDGWDFWHPTPEQYAAGEHYGWQPNGVSLENLELVKNIRLHLTKLYPELTKALGSSPADNTPPTGLRLALDWLPEVAA